MSTQALREVVLGIAVVALLVGPVGSPAHAQNAGYQSFFFDVCGGPTVGALATRCGDTPGGTGDLSSDSEDSLNPGQNLRLNEAGLARARALSREIQERLESRRGEPKPAPDDSIGGRFGLFATGRLEFADRDASQLERGYDSETYGVQIGGDLRVGTNGFVGVLLGYDRSNAEFDRDTPALNFTPQSDDGEAEGDHYSVDFYGSLSLTEALYADASVGYGFADYDYERKAIFQETNRVVAQTNLAARSDVEAHGFRASGGIGYDAPLGATTVSPYARLNYAVSRIDSFDESDPSGLGMDVDAASHDSLSSIAGIRFSHALSLPFGVLVPQVRFEWEHQYMGDRQDIDSSFVLDSAGNEFSLRGNSPDQDFFNLAGALSLVLPQGWVGFVDYEALLGHKRLDRHRVNFGIRKEFR